MHDLKRFERIWVILVYATHQQKFITSNNKSLMCEWKGHTHRLESQKQPLAKMQSELCIVYVITNA